MIVNWSDFSSEWVAEEMLYRVCFLRKVIFDFKKKRKQRGNQCLKVFVVLREIIKFV